MSGRSKRLSWLVEQPGLTALALVGSLLALAVLLPYLQFVLFGVVLAYIMFPLQQRAERYMRPTFAALRAVSTTTIHRTRSCA